MHEHPTLAQEAAPAEREHPLDRAMLALAAAALERMQDDGYTRAVRSPDGRRRVTVVVAVDGAAARLDGAVWDAAGKLDAAVARALDARRHVSPTPRRKWWRLGG